MINRIYRWTTVVLVCAFTSCYPEGAEYADELDLVYTNYDSEFTFSSRLTYTIPDSVIKITGDVFNDPDGDAKPQFLSATYSVPLVAEIKKNMAANGWTLVDKSADPDVALLVSSMSTTNVYYYYDWSYWGWWYPGYDPFWGWYYPGTYYPNYVSGYRSGSIFLQMVDHKVTSAGTGSVPVVWNCILNGLAEGSSDAINSRIQASVATAFPSLPI